MVACSTRFELLPAELIACDCTCLFMSARSILGSMPLHTHQDCIDWELYMGSLVAKGTTIVCQENATAHTHLPHSSELLWQLHVSKALPAKRHSG